LEDYLDSVKHKRHCEDTFKNNLEFDAPL